MKKLLIIPFLLISLILSAADHYVATGGGGLGTLVSPFASITQVNAHVFVPGDNIYFNRGDTFTGTLVLDASGTSGNVITFGAYGTGVNPIITGFITITDWTDETEIHSKVISSVAQTNMVIIDGVQYGMGRYPNSSYLTYNAVTNHDPVAPLNRQYGTITDNGLGDAINWTDAEAVIRKDDYSLDRCHITGHSGDVLSYHSIDSYSTAYAYATNQYFIQNDLRCVTVYGEWYHNTTTGKFSMYFGGVDPTTKTVKVATINNLITNAGYDYITLDNLTITGSIADAVKFETGSYNCIIQNCTISFAGKAGIDCSYSNNNGIIDNNSILNCNWMGVGKGGTGGTVSNNIIRNVGVIVGQTFAAEYCDGIYVSGAGYTVEYNEIHNVCYNGVYMSGNGTIQYNLIDSTCVILDDGGGIYTNLASTSSRIIRGNIITNTIENFSVGIYLDELSNNVSVLNNTIYNSNYAGIKIHRGNTNTISGNTVYNNPLGIVYQNSAYTSTIFNNVMNSNIFFAKIATQQCLWFRSNTNDIPSFGTASNNYYVRPIADNTVFYIWQPSLGLNFLNYNLGQWQSFTGKDADSHSSPTSITDVADIEFYYNPTQSDSVISVTDMIDMTGTKYTSSITLAPYTSAVLIPDAVPGPPVVPAYASSQIGNTTPTKLEMTYTLSLANIVPATSAFTVMVNSVARTVNSVAISGTVVTLTLASAVVNGDIVTVAYTKPVSNMLQTPAGGEAASITAQAVTNNVLVPGATYKVLRFETNNKVVKNSSGKIMKQ